MRAEQPHSRLSEETSIGLRHGEPMPLSVTYRIVVDARDRRAVYYYTEERLAQRRVRWTRENAHAGDRLVSAEVTTLVVWSPMELPPA